MATRVKINIENTISKVSCSIKDLQFLRKNLRIRVPGAFFSDAFRNRTWDGFSYYITESGSIYTGLIPKLCNLLNKEDIGYSLIDNRKIINPGNIPKKLGNLELRQYQFEAVKCTVENYFENIYFPRGILDEATNAGKNLMAAALFKSYNSQYKLIFIVNRLHIYKQAKIELSELIGENELGWIGSDGIKWNRFMVCMAQTLSHNLNPEIRTQLSKFDMCMVDECHYSSSKTFKGILLALNNCFVRVGLSGTPFKHKDKNKNERILSFFGPVLHKTSNDFLIKKGFSTKPIVTILEGNTLINIPGNYKEEETLGLTKSKERNNKLIKRLKKHVRLNRLPILVICKFHHHTELVFRKVKKKFPRLKIKFIHVGVSNRFKIMDEFKEGKIDILVSSKIIKEGKNLPLIKVLSIACGGDSVIDVLQVVGRALRKHNTKDKVYIDDFFDQGYYLRRHSRRRVKVYKDEKFLIKTKVTI